MAIIRASKNFEGGELTQKAASYIKPGIRTVDFKNKDNGVYLFLLGAFKTDSHGAGVWYRPLKVRDNFGMGMYKKKFAIQPNCPIEYFANKVQTFAADMAKSKKVEEEGRERWVYPAWGRVAWRVLYNAALFGDYNAGVHVLDLPQSGGASVIDAHVKGKQEDNTDNPDLTDYENAIPINIKLDLKAQGQPWKIQINSAKKYKLPVELADTEYLYNLDDVILFPNKEALIDELKSIVPTDVFRKGMEGYNDGHIPYEVETELNTPAPAPREADAPTENPVASLPKANIPKSVTVAPTFNIPKSAPKAESLPEAPAFSVPSNSTALATAAAYLSKKK